MSSVSTIGGPGLSSLGGFSSLSGLGGIAGSNSAGMVPDMMHSVLPLNVNGPSSYLDTSAAGLKFDAQGIPIFGDSNPGNVIEVAPTPSEAGIGMGMAPLPSNAASTGLKSALKNADGPQPIRKSVGFASSEPDTAQRSSPDTSRDTALRPSPDTPSTSTKGGGLAKRAAHASRKAAAHEEAERTGDKSTIARLLANPMKTLSNTLGLDKDGLGDEITKLSTIAKKDKPDGLTSNYIRSTAADLWKAAKLKTPMPSALASATRPTDTEIGTISRDTRDMVDHAVKTLQGKVGKMAKGDEWLGGALSKAMADTIDKRFGGYHTSVKSTPTQRTAKSAPTAPTVGSTVPTTVPQPKPAPRAVDTATIDSLFTTDPAGLKEYIKGLPKTEQKAASDYAVSKGKATTAARRAPSAQSSAAASTNRPSSLAASNAARDVSKAGAVSAVPSTVPSTAKPPDIAKIKHAISTYRNDPHNLEASIMSMSGEEQTIAWNMMKQLTAQAKQRGMQSTGVSSAPTASAQGMTSSHLTQTQGRSANQEFTNVINTLRGRSTAIGPEAAARNTYLMTTNSGKKELQSMAQPEFAEATKGVQSELYTRVQTTPWQTTADGQTTRTVQTENRDATIQQTQDPHGKLITTMTMSNAALARSNIPIDEYNALMAAGNTTSTRGAETASSGGWSSYIPNSLKSMVSAGARGLRVA